MASTIGIKIANGEFYSLVEENSQVKKRLILTTVHDKQESVQIDLYKSKARIMADAVYIGSLVIEKIKTRRKGEPSIEMIISSTKDGKINAEALDLDSGPGGEHHYLSVSLKSLAGTASDFDIPDFELEQNGGPPAGLYEKSLRVRSKEPSRFPIGAFVAAIIVGLIILAAGLWYFLFGGKEWAGFRQIQQSINEYFNQNQSAPAEEPIAAPLPPVIAPAPAPAETPVPVREELPVNEISAPAEEAPPVIAETPAPASPPVIEAPQQAPAQTAVDRTRNPPVASYRVPAVIPRDGAPYQIRWGDTLWDISEAFYRTPWLYTRIARFNNIRNPDRIISGTTIRIPPRE